MSKRSREQDRLNQELQDQLDDLKLQGEIDKEADYILEQRKLEGLEDYAFSNFKRAPNPSGTLAPNALITGEGITDKGPGGFTNDDNKKFGQIAGSKQLDPGEIAPSLPIGSGNIEQLYDSSNIT